MTARPQADTRNAASEGGQALVLTLVSLVVLLGMAAFVIDVGRAYYVHRSLQADADAAALAGAQALPNGTNAAQIARVYGAGGGGRNQNSNIEGVTETISTECFAGSSCAPVNAVVVEEQADVNTLFARVLGRTLFTVRARSAACSPASGTAVLIDLDNPTTEQCAGAAALPVCTTTSLSSNFNGTSIAAGRYVWFNAVVKVSNAGSGPVTIGFDHQQITFTANGTHYTLTPPDSSITLASTTAIADTAWDTAHNRWNTTAPISGLSGNVFLGGFGFHVPAGGLPGGINPVTWSGRFTSDTDGASLSWKWAAAVYTQFNADNGALGVKPVDDNNKSVYHNSDHAGTPENYKSYVTGGARGGGGSNNTGSYTGTYTTNGFSSC